jgi:hypothetical protein
MFWFIILKVHFPRADFSGNGTLPQGGCVLPLQE